MKNCHECEKTQWFFSATGKRDEQTNTQLQSRKQHKYWQGLADGVKWLACEGPSNSILLTTYEDVEPANLLQIVEDLLGGYWKNRLASGKAGRDGVLDLIGKATPGTFQPSLQIDGTGAKLLIEALSGRWSYDTERRDKRTVWYHVANAFSLLVSTIAPMPSNEQIKVISNYDR